MIETPRVIADAAGRNVDSAVRASLVLLPETFTPDSLFEAVCGLSYFGTCACHAMPHRTLGLCVGGGDRVAAGGLG